MEWGPEPARNPRAEKSRPRKIGTLQSKSRAGAARCEAGFVQPARAPIAPRLKASSPDCRNDLPSHYPLRTPFASLLNDCACETVVVACHVLDTSLDLRRKAKNATKAAAFSRQKVPASRANRNGACFRAEIAPTT